MRSVCVSAMLLLVVALHVPQSSSAQVYYGGYRPYGYSPWGGAMPAYAGGTVAGSYGVGMGAMIQSQGAYNQMTAEAAIKYQQAKSLALDNKLKTAQTQYQLQRMNQENRAEQERQRLANVKAYNPPPPKRLTSEQLDPVSGKIYWPATLAAPTFSPEREQLDALFAQRAKNPAAVSLTEISQLVLAMRDKLDGLYGMVGTGDFFAARHFLEAVNNEARFNGYDNVASTGQ